MESLKVNNLNFSYNNKNVLNNISLSIEKNIVFGLLGPNGAGKTTLLECIQGLKKNYKGDIIIEGLNLKNDIKKIHEIIGVQFQSNDYFDYIKVKELFYFFSCLYKIKINDKEIYSLLNSVSMLKEKNSYVNKLSGGQKQKISIALSILNNPKVLFLDEPTTGLDPISRNELWKIIRNIKKSGTTIIITTHYMEEVEELCDKICFINNGRIYDIDTPQNLIKKSNIESTVLIEVQGNIDCSLLEKESIIRKVEKQNSLYKIYTNNHSKCIKLIYSLEQNNNFKILNLNTRKANLEDVFLKITGGNLNNEKLCKIN